MAMVSGGLSARGWQHLRDAAAIVHRRRQRGKYDGLDLAFGKRSGVCDVGLTRKNGTVDQRLNELQNRRLHKIEILNVDLSRIQARPGTCDTATVPSGLFAAHDLYAVRK
jgi:hypothetical protein